MSYPKLSIIIPVYGVEKYIERCAISLFEQSLREIEYIFVDDCTPDNSVELLRQIIKRYPNRENNIKIVSHKNNKGLPFARRTGLNMATGKYIAHCDSDDWVDKNMYEQLYLKAEQDNADVVVCPFMESDGCNTPKPLSCFPYAKNGVITNKLSCWENEGSLCNKIFRRELYQNDITYPTGNMGEDMCLVYQLIYFCKKISFVPDVFYYIYKNPLSITRKPTRQNIYNNFVQGCENCKIVENFYLKKNAVDEDTRRALIRLKYSKREILRPIVGLKKYHIIWCQTFPEIDNSILKDSSLTVKEKIKSICIRFRIYPFPWKRCLINK